MSDRTAQGVKCVGSERLARRVATREHESWCLCVLDGNFYVGPKDELAKLGVVIKG